MSRGVIRQGVTRPPPPAAPPKPRIEVTSAHLVREEGAGSIDIEIANDAGQAVQEVKLALHYLDSRGVRIGSWTTSRRVKPHVAPAQGRGKFTEMAMRMPTAARKVEVVLLSARLADDTAIDY